MMKDGFILTMVTMTWLFITEELVRLKPDSSAMYYNLGLAYYRKGSLNEAENNFKKPLNYIRVMRMLVLILVSIFR